MHRALKVGIFLALFLGAVAIVPANAQSRSTRNSPSYQGSEPLDLAMNNQDRVAAAAAQIKEVLLIDPGILVELKRYVAKEATDNGQIVDDAALTDAAIFDRLERDVPFRSLATRLVQRYGYLLPSVNPLSDAGKQNELVLKERARRMVQVEAQEDAQAVLDAKKDAAREETEGKCDPQQDSTCGQAPPTRTKRSTAPQEKQPSEQDTLPLPGGIPGFSSPQLMRTGDSSTSNTDLRGTSDTAAALRQLGIGGGSSDRNGFDLGSGDDSDSNARVSKLAQGFAGAQGMGGLGSSSSSGSLPLPLDFSGLGGYGDEGRGATSPTTSSVARESAPKKRDRKRAVSRFHHPQSKPLRRHSVALRLVRAGIRKTENT